MHTRTLMASSLLVCLASSAGVALAQSTLPPASPSPSDPSTYFIVTRQDTRRCAYPICGGYFVKAVNSPSTRCADGVLRAECHVVDFDFSATGLSPKQAANFQNEVFGPGFGLTRGALKQRPTPSGLRADTMIVTEAWEGQARSKPTGVFGRFESTGIVCVTFPCDSFQGAFLNTARSARFNAIDLASSGAPPEAVARGEQALASDFILAAGKVVPIVGPAGRGQDFATSEFYLQVKPKVSCDPQDASGIGLCKRLFGFAWNGEQCVVVGGCSCRGADCDALYPSLEACAADHAHCRERACGARLGPVCEKTEFCDFPDGAMCDYADQTGICRPRPEVCTKIFAPVCGCNGQTYSNACEANASGVDVLHDGPC